VRLQALARGRQARKRSAFSLAATHDWFAGVFGFESGAPSSQALRERNAQLLFPAEEACLERLAQLRSALDAECGEAWTAPHRRAPHVAIDIRPESASLLPPAPAPEVEPPKASYLSRLKKKALYLESRDGAVALLQARARGRRARKQKRRGAGEEAEEGVEASTACFPTPVDCRPRPTARSLLLGCLLCVPLLLLSPLLLLCLAACYAYLRLPYLLGWVTSKAITRLGLFGYPLTFGAIHLSPWLELRPARLHLRLCVEDFSLSNPPSLGCPHRHFVSAGALDFLLTIDLRWLRELLRTGRLQPVPVHFEQTRVQRVKLFFELYQGQLNINALTREIAEREVRAALASRARSCCRRQPAPALPNLLRLRIGAVRGLRRSGTKPFCVVRARGVALLTTIGTLVGGAEGSGGEWVFDAEMLLRVSDPSTVLHVCVYSSVGRDQLLGQWVLTLKYLVTQPDYCKHAPPLTRSRDGSISGTFYLSDAKLRGSAVRALGPSELGKGFSGEVDMRLHWMHAASLPPPPPPKRRTAMEQLNENSGETALRLGNVRELRTALSSLPLRLSCGEVAFRDVSVGIKDLFTGYKGDIEMDLRDELANCRSTSSRDRLYEDRAEEVTDVVNMKDLFLHPVAAKDGSGLDLTAFLDGLLFDQLVPEALKEVFGTGLGGQAIGQILGGVAARSAEWARGVRRGFVSSGQGRNIPRVSPKAVL